MLNCLRGCVREYDRRGIRKALNHAMIQPWVKVWIARDRGFINRNFNLQRLYEPPDFINNKLISVSNFSSRHTKAMIKSFQFGLSNGNGALIEIVDEEGGNFSNFFRKISTGNLESSEKYLMRFRFGWAFANCDGTGVSEGPEINCALLGGGATGQASQSTEHTMVIKNISVHVSHGAFKFSIEGEDLTMDMFTTRDAGVYGGDGKELPVVEAIRKLFAKYGVEVDFRQLNGSCRPEPLRFKRQGRTGFLGNILNPFARPTESPNGVYEAKNRTPIQAARDWLNLYVSEKGKGFVTYWDVSNGKPTLVFMETNQLTCETVKDMGNFNLGTYIVSGGSCSPVLSFTPQIQYVMEQALVGTSGVQGGTLDGHMRVEDGPEPCFRGRIPNAKNQGRQATQTEDRNAHNAFFNQATEVSGKNKMANQHANIMAHPFTAELRIQGDPSYDKPIFTRGFYISIVHINPFRIVPTGNGCEWRSLGFCQEQLSNANWMILGVFHEIKEGSFTTTLKLKLAAPGLDLPRDSTLGGSPDANTIPNR